MSVEKINTMYKEILEALLSSTLTNTEKSEYPCLSQENLFEYRRLLRKHKEENHEV